MPTRHPPLLWFFFSAACLLHPDGPLLATGWSDTKPESGPSVRVGDRWMVPYRQRIPGTDQSFDMVPIPGGTFKIGSPQTELGRKFDEGPQVQVKVSPLWVGRLEVTQGEYQHYEDLYTRFKKSEVSREFARTVDRDRVDVVTAPTAIYDPASIHEFGLGDHLPAVAMTQYAAMQYTKWLSIVTGDPYRLPTEAEWEYACRGGTTGAYSWGNAAEGYGDYAWNFGGKSWTDQNDEEFRLHQGGQKKPNPFGLFDMHGHVGEWTASAYTRDGYAGWQALASQRKRPIDPIADNRWPRVATSCVVRGGHLDSELAEIRSASRLESDDDEWKDEDANYPQSPWWHTTDPARIIGFRLFRSAEPLSPETLSKFWNHTAADVREDVDSRLAGGRGAVGVVKRPASFAERPADAKQLNVAPKK
ncbi:MAG: formylglycine-generating enzyme family protein [Planctomycetota bacterium]